MAILQPPAPPAPSLGKVRMGSESQRGLGPTLGCLATSQQRVSRGGQSREEVSAVSACGLTTVANTSEALISNASGISRPGHPLLLCLSSQRSRMALAASPASRCPGQGGALPTERQRPGPIGIPRKVQRSWQGLPSRLCLLNRQCPAGWGPRPGSGNYMGVVGTAGEKPAGSGALGLGVGGQSRGAHYRTIQAASRSTIGKPRAGPGR